jgi:hypothetical protein
VLIFIGGDIGGAISLPVTTTIPPPNNSTATNSSVPCLQKFRIAALGWVDSGIVNHYRVYHQPANRDEPNIFESA